MSKALRAISATIVLLLVTLSILVSTSPNAAAASTTWTTDADFTGPGAGGSTPTFTGTRLVGAGVPARVELVKDVMDWANKNPASAPPAREGAGLAFSSYDGLSVLFGGYGLTGNDLSDTWEYDFPANAWTQITGNPHPDGREFPGLSYDPVQRVVVLFGGVNGTNGFLNDTWEFNVVTRTWSQQSPSPAPPAMVDNPLAYYTSAAQHVLIGQPITLGPYETWAYNAVTHTWSNQNAGGPSPIRSGFAVAYHEARDRLVLFGGSQFTTPLADTWEYNFAARSWAQIGAPGPSARAGHGMTFQPATSSVILFGGAGSGGATLQDTWAYTAAGSWQTVPTIQKPPPRQYIAFASDPADGVLVLFGGTTGTTQLGDTWTLGAAYRSAGKYTSNVFDSGGANVVWGTLWWNRTPANQPANTFLRFQLAAADAVAGPYSFGGPSCTVTSYFTVVPSSISLVCLNNHRYIRFLADYGSFDSQVSPILEDLTINFDVPVAPPYIVSTDPRDMTFGVPANKEVNITFSKPMDPASLTWSFLMGPAVTLTPTWMNGNSEVHLSHTQPFAENKVYQLQISASDPSAAPLVPGPVPNPWIFVTEAIYPTIVRTIPDSSAPNVANASAIVVDFSEPMKQSSLQVSTTPNLGLTAAWSNGDQTVTLSHGTRFTQCIRYTVQVNATDLADLPLVPGPVPNPWTFSIACPNPFITAQSPVHLAGNVAFNAPVVVDFSEPMVPATVTFTISPTVGGQTLTWANGNTRLTMTHTSPFVACGVYTVTITGRDADENLPLIDNPFDPTIKNPWKFVAVCPNPYIVLTSPEDGETNVVTNREILILFSEPLDITSFQYTVTGGTWTEISRSWDMNTMVHLTHQPLQECKRYTFRVTQARNVANNPLVPGPAPNPWSFDVECVSPYVTSTDPVDGAGLVAVNHVVFVNFSAPMDTSTVVFRTTPTVVVTGMVWSNGDQTLMVNHADFTACLLYQATVDGLDKAGRSLLTGPAAPSVPDPWTFTTKCAGFYIARTDPADTQTDVPFTYPITVEFSLAADPTAFQVTVSPAVGTLVPTWSGGNTIVTVAHSTSFSDCVLYTVTVSAKDTLGNSLINVTGSKRNPWTFRAHCIPPEILSTNPADTSTGVLPGAPIVVTFSEAMLTSSVTWVPSPSIPLSPTWSVGNTVLTLTHTAPFLSNTQYCVTIAGKDVDAVDLAPGPVPNPWCFTTTAGLAPPAGLHVSRATPNIVLTWTAVPGATDYVIYSSLNRFAAWPWPQLGTSTVPSFTHTTGDTDGATHYYIVRARDSGGVLGSNSTMGVKTPLSFTFNGVTTNVYWISLPYRAKYHTAKDISDELTNLKIDLVGKWNPATQSSVVWVYFRGSWRGANFAINPGDGLFLGVRSAFSWVVNGTDGSVPHTFTAYPPPNANIHWFGLPYTSVYGRASDVVLDIEGSLGPGANTKIVEVVKWNPATQTTIRFFWTTAGWSGTDFTILPGDGTYFKVASTFTWAPRLITSEVP